MLDVLDIPESSADLGPWLDRLVVSPTLADAVDDLSAIHDATEGNLAVEEARNWLGSNVAAVLEQGLGVVGNERLRELLMRPALLPAIQEIVFVDGGAYWNRLVAESPFDDPRPQASQARPRWLFVMAPLAIAASIAAFVAVEMRVGPKAGRNNHDPDLTVMRGTNGDSAPAKDDALQPWGWNRMGLVDDVAESAAVADRLASALEDWFTVTATGGDSDLATIRSQTEELWAGCEQVLALPFVGMAPEFRKEVRSRITLFQKRLQALLQQVDDGESTNKAPVVAADIKREVDSLVRGTASALRQLK